MYQITQFKGLILSNLSGIVLVDYKDWKVLWSFW